MKDYPRKGLGLDAFVDAGDTGYTIQGKPVEDGQMHKVDHVKNGHLNGHASTAVEDLKEIMNGCDHAHVNNVVAVADGNGT